MKTETETRGGKGGGDRRGIESNLHLVKPLIKFLLRYTGAFPSAEEHWEMERTFTHAHTAAFCLHFYMYIYLNYRHGWITLDWGHR